MLFFCFLFYNRPVNNPAVILKNTFGYNTFRPLQREIIDNVLARRDTLAIMPTGGGKSLCYQIPALVFEGLSVIVSPLIALMKDQVEQLRAYGVPALFLNSSLSAREYQQNMQLIRSGKVRLLFVAPETLLTPRIFSLLEEQQIDLITIDEAHCISEWGHDFRPEYRQLAEVRRRYPQAVCLALTATATPRVRKDIQTSLGFSKTNEFMASFNRENLFIEVSPKEDAFNQTLEFLKRFKDQSGIIYCFSRKQVDNLSELLSQSGFSVRPYHAGLDDEARKLNQEAFIRDDVQIIVATIAFGMGINKPNVRFILHHDLPKSIEGYYQEIGRAGRDGLPAHCLLLYSYSDVAKLRYFINQKEGMERAVAEQHLQAIIDYAEDRTVCRRKPLLNYFGEEFPPAGGLPPTGDKGRKKDLFSCNNCDNCTGTPPVLRDVTIPAQKFLSCVTRCGESFGMAHIVDILRGSQNEKIKRFEHDKLSTFGIGKEWSKKEWMALGRELLRQGYLKEGEYHCLALSERAVQVLRKRLPVQAQYDEPVQTPSTGKRSSSELNYNPELFDLLRKKRKEIADAVSVPPYVIFPDTTLVEMSFYFPQSLESLLDISGVGQVKLRQFGESFLNIIGPFCQEHGLQEKPKPGSSQPQKISFSGQRSLLVGRAYNKGESVQELARQHKVKPATILKHLENYLRDGHPLRSTSDLTNMLSCSNADQQAAFKAYQNLGTDMLKPIYDLLGGRVNYEDLRTLRIIFLSSQKNSKES